MTEKYRIPGTENDSEKLPPDDANFPAFVNTLAATARGLKMSEKSLRRLIDRRLISASRGLRHIRITRQAILDYLEKTSD